MTDSINSLADTTSLDLFSGLAFESLEKEIGRYFEQMCSQLSSEILDNISDPRNFSITDEIFEKAIGPELADVLIYGSGEKHDALTALSDIFLLLVRARADNVTDILDLNLNEKSYAIILNDFWTPLLGKYGVPTQKVVAAVAYLLQKYYPTFLDKFPTRPRLAD